MKGKQANVIASKKILYRDVPKDVQQYLIDFVNSERDNCDCMRSQDYALTKIAREHQRVFNGEPKVVLHGKQIDANASYSLENGNIIITLAIPLATPLGLELNQRRIGQEKSK